MDTYELRQEILDWQKPIDEEPNSSYFFGLIDRDPGREEMIEIYTERRTTSWTWEDLLTILGWKYNVSGIDQYATKYKALKQMGEEMALDVFKTHLTRNSDISDINSELAEALPKYIGFRTTSTFLLFSLNAPILDQHAHRALRFLHEQDEYNDVLSLERPTKYPPGNETGYGRYIRNFYRVMEVLELEKHSLSDVMAADKCLFNKGKELKNEGYFD